MPGGTCPSTCLSRPEINKMTRIPSLISEDSAKIQESQEAQAEESWQVPQVPAGRR
jgi:hypothetical protein